MKITAEVGTQMHPVAGTVMFFPGSISFSPHDNEELGISTDLFGR